jgi:hypothetical protein
VQYTIAQSYSDDDNERSAGGYVYDNPANLKLEYGYSNLDIRNNFATYALGRLPMGLQLSGTFAASSGQPIDPTAGSDVNGDGSNSDRAFKAPGVPFARNSFRNYGFKSVNMRLLKDFKVGEKARLQLSFEAFNLFNFDNVIIGGPTSTSNFIYGLGVAPDGSTAAPRTDSLGPTFMRLKRPDGLYDTNNFQVGTPFQSQFGVRFLF